MPSPDPARWARLQTLFAELADAPPAERAPRLEALARDDAALAQELNELLALDDNAAAAAALTQRLNNAVATFATDLDGGGAAPGWVGDYRITGTLGSGGMGIVYLAEQESPRRTVALKVIRTFGGATAVRRFQREAELHGRLQHPGIALIYEAGVAAERDATGTGYGPPRPYFAMEYVHGLPVTTYIERHHLSTDARVELVARICDAIEHAHARGVIHRDLKSANVLVDEHGSPKVLDFGIARAVDRDQAATLETAVGEVIGTLPYMSPEQVSGNPHAIGVRSDVYALGVVLFEALTGRRPLDLAGCSVPEAVRIVSDDEPTRLGTIDRTLRGDLETIAGRCLEKDPARRYATAGALAADLRRYLAHKPIDARPASTMYQLSKFARRHRPLVAGVCTAFTALLVATVISIVMAVEAHRAGEDLKVQLRESHVQNARSTESFAFLSGLLTAADPARSGGRDMTVRELVVKASESLDGESTTSSEVRGMLARLIGYTLAKLGDHERAERTLRRSAELLRESDDNAVSREKFLTETLANLGDLLRERGKLDEAAEVLAEAIDIRQSSLRREFAAAGMPLAPDQRPVDPGLAAAMNNLSLVHQSRGAYADAERLARQAYDMEVSLVKNGWNRRTNMATALVNVASAQLLQGRARDAEPSLRAAVAIHEELSGPDAPITQTVRNNLASCLRGVGRYDESLALITRVNETRRRTLPATHFEISRGDANLAQTLAAAGHLLEALQAVDRAIELARTAEPGSTGQRARLDGMRAMWRALAGYGAGAARDAATAREAAETVYGPAHIRMAEALACEATALRAAGECAAALATAERAVAIATAAQGAQHPVCAHAQRECGLAALACGRAGDAAATLHALADAQIATLGAEHPVRGLVLLDLAYAQLAGGQRREAAATACAAAEVLAQPGGVAPWYAQCAAALAAIATSPAPPADACAALEQVEQAITLLSGEHAIDLQRARSLRGPVAHTRSDAEYP